MKLIKILFAIFVIWMITGAVLLNMKHPKAEVVMGLGVFFMAFVLMPVFIYHRYKDGKYKKYILDSNKNKKVED